MYHTHAVPAEAKRGHLNPSNWSCESPSGVNSFVKVIQDQLQKQPFGGPTLPCSPVKHSNLYHFKCNINHEYSVSSHNLAGHHLPAIR